MFIYCEPNVNVDSMSKFKAVYVDRSSQGDAIRVGGRRKRGY